MRHRAPPHRSTRTFEFEVPTAVQVPAAGHATANKVLDEDPAGFGVGWMRQSRPFHRSASVSCTPDLTTNCPTPVHADLDGHDTPLKALAAAPAGLGVDWTVQVPPLRRSASVTSSPDSRTCKPTAVHTGLAGQDTALSRPFPARGFGVGVIDHPAPGSAAGSARPPGWPPTSRTFAPAGATNAATASTAEAMLARLARSMRIRPPAGLSWTRRVPGRRMTPAHQSLAASITEGRAQHRAISPAGRLLIAVSLPG
jgi:hypothetical protein